MACTKGPSTLVILATLWLFSVAERPRLNLTEQAAQDEMVAIAVEHHYQERWPLVRRHVDFELPAKDATAPRIVQSGGSRPTALAQASIASGDTSLSALVATGRTDPKDSQGNLKKRSRAEFIGKSGPKAVLAAMADLKAWALLAEADSVREKAAWAIGVGGPKAVSQAMIELKASANDADTGVRRNAVWAIGMGGPEAVLQSMDDLKLALNDSHKRVRCSSLFAIGKGGPKAVFQAMDELLVQLQHEDKKVRVSAAQAISQGGPEAVLQASAKLKVSHQGDVDDRAAGELRKVRPIAIRHAGPEAVLQALGELKDSLGDADKDIVKSAAWAIAEGGPKAVLQAMTELKKCLQDDSKNIREKAASAIGMGGPKAVLQAMDELKQTLEDKDVDVRRASVEAIGFGGAEALRQCDLQTLLNLLTDTGDEISEAAAATLRAGGTHFISSAVAYIRPFLGEEKGYTSMRVHAIKVLGMLGPSAIEEGNLGILLWVLGRKAWPADPPNEQEEVAASAQAAARVLADYINSGPKRVPVEVFDRLEVATESVRQSLLLPIAERELESAVQALTKFAEDRCMGTFRQHVNDLVLVKRWVVEVPKGRMVEIDIKSVDRGLQAHRCPNVRACPGENFSTTYATNASCPLARKAKPGAPCSDGYDNEVAGCAGCLKDWGRNQQDPYVCQDCGNIWKRRAIWLGIPSAVLAVSMWSARRAAAPGDAAAFSNDALKITISFSSTATVVLTSLATSETYQHLSKRAQDWLHISSDVIYSVGSASSSSADCVVGRVLSLNELLALSLANPAIVLTAAVLMLGLICIIRRWQGVAEQHSSFTEDMMTLGLVSGNLYLPKIAAACVIAIPCFHTQTENMSEEFRMAYSPLEGCQERLQYMVMRAPVLALVLVFGPALWLWLLRHHHEDEGERRYQVLRFLTASYRPGEKGWEANRLAKNILVTCAVAVSPTSYCPGSQLTSVLCIMVSFTAMHMMSRPYKFALLNKVEGISLWVLNICMLISSLATRGAWYLTTEFAGLLIYTVYGLLAINTVGLMSLFLWGKFMLRDGHPALEDVTVVLTGKTQADQN